MHLGNARTALLAWLQMRAAGGAFVLRIEDLDLGRTRPAYEDLLIEDLRWLGLDWDEGPDVGGPHGPYRQSEREPWYTAALARLDTYPCVCSRKEIRAATLAPHGAEPVYPGTCRERPRQSSQGGAWRWRVPQAVVRVEDAWRGAFEQDVAQEAGDFVLRRSDGAWAYQLAVVVDDAAMEVTHVLRGADLLESTPRQVLLQRALGLPTPHYAHAPLLCGPDGEKLSKRHLAPDIAALRTRGGDPERVVAELARSLGLLPRGVARVSARALVADFELARVQNLRIPFDLTAL